MWRTECRQGLEWRKVRVQLGGLQWARCKMIRPWTLGGLDGGLRSDWIEETFERRPGRRMVHTEEMACAKILRRNKILEILLLCYIQCVCLF